MTQYLYQCRSCGDTKEVEHSIKESPDVQCQWCERQGKTMSLMHRIIFPPHVQFKGTGFYATDYPRHASSRLDR